MKTKKIVSNLKEIEKIVKHQANQIVDKRVENRVLFLRGSIDFIKKYISEIEKEIY